MARISDDELIRHLTPPPGIRIAPYPARRDRIYRFSLLFTGIGLVGETIAAFFHQSLAMTVFQAWVSMGLVMAGWTFLVWLPSWRWLVRGLVTAGLLLWPLTSIGGWALSLAGAAIMAAKETHCFHFWAGRLIPWAVILLGVTLVIPPARVAAPFAWLILTVLWAFLLQGRWQLPLLEVH